MGTFSAKEKLKNFNKFGTYFGEAVVDVIPYLLRETALNLV